ncbi:unnamed protein product [Adineta steineri]|uniref:HMG box domain-containing protein n=1 Tax=Adineta steineri TaxID=433720 RepID=A0A819TQX0_9BILA|nr:unnamed protein product [Adineta steineri]CAF4077157.1 unnamed protein product [Adineta steineri]
MPTNILLAPTLMPGKTDLSSSATTLDLSIKSSSTKLSKSPERQMSSSTTTTATLQKSLSPSKLSVLTTDPGGGGGSSSTTDSDEVKVFGCEKHEEDVDIDGDASSDRLSPVIKEEESSPQQAISNNLADRLNSEHQFHSFFPYFISPYYHAAAAGSATPPFDKMAPLSSLSKFMSPPPAHISSANLGIDPSTGVPNSMYSLSSPSSFQSLYAQHWRPPMFPFVFPPGYPFSPAVLSHGSPSTHTPSGHSSSIASHSNSPLGQKRSTTHRSMDNSPQQQQHHKLSMSHDEKKPKKPHIKKPLNAFMLFMKEQRAQVVQECTLRESAAINQILGRKWHELDRNVQQKYYDMARDERMKHMQLYPGWSARDNYGARKKRGSKGKKREKSQGENGECLNQKKCRARFGLDQQSNWCKHCKRKKKCLRYTEDETACAGPNSVGGDPWSEEDDTDNIDGSDDGIEHCDIPMIEHSEEGNIHNTNGDNHSPHRGGISIDSDEENKSRILMHQQPPSSNGSGSSSTNGTVPMTMMTAAAAAAGMTTTTSSRKDSSSSSSSPQASFLQFSHQRYPIAAPPHFPSQHNHHHHHHHPYFDPFLQPTSMPLLNGLKRET